MPLETIAIFFLASLACTFVLYAPGFLCVRPLVGRSSLAFALAPLPTLVILGVTGIALERAGQAVEAWVLLAVALAFGACFFLVASLIKVAFRRGGKASAHTAPVLPALPYESTLWPLMGFYVLMGVIFAYLFLFAYIDPTSAVAFTDDTPAHLSYVRAFLDSGTYSTLRVSAFLEQDVNVGYYPALWHVLTAITASLFNGNVALAANASIMVCVAVVAPAGFCALLAAVFGNRGPVLWWGGVLATSFAGFLWPCLIIGQLLPNLLSFALIPSAMTALVGAYRATGGLRARFVLLFFAGIAAVGLVHPNGVFTLGIWVVTFAVGAILTPKNKCTAGQWAKRILLAVVVIVVACAAWYVINRSPFLEAVVTNHGGRVNISWPLGLVSGFSFMFVPILGPQIFQALVVLIGVVATLRHRRYLWLTGAFLIGMFIYLVCSCMPVSTFRDIICGFWYNVNYRIICMTCLFAIPLAALGAGSLWEILARLFTPSRVKYRYQDAWIATPVSPQTSSSAEAAEANPPAQATDAAVAAETAPVSTESGASPAVGAEAPEVPVASESEAASEPESTSSQVKASEAADDDSLPDVYEVPIPTDCPAVYTRVSRRGASTHRLSKGAQVIAALILAALFAFSQFCPFTMQIDEYTIGAAMLRVNERFEKIYDPEAVYTQEEREFIEQVNQIVGDDEYIINFPYDGSGWAYAVDNANVLFRRSTQSGANFFDSKQNALLRTALNGYSTKKGVQDFLNENDLRYVLLLDVAPDGESVRVNAGYHPEAWAGIEDITDDTPGFNVVLSEGDMRLYEIEPIEAQ